MIRRTILANEVRDWLPYAPVARWSIDSGFDAVSTEGRGFESRPYAAFLPTFSEDVEALVMCEKAKFDGNRRARGNEG